MHSIGIIRGVQMVHKAASERASGHDEIHFNVIVPDNGNLGDLFRELKRMTDGTPLCVVTVDLEQREINFPKVGDEL